MENVLQGSDFLTAIIIAIYAITLSQFGDVVAIVVGAFTGLWVLFQLVRGIIRFSWEIKDRKKKNEEYGK